MKSRTKKKASPLRAKMNVFDVLLYLFMGLFVLSVLYPFWDLMVKSFSSPSAATKLTFSFFPEKWSLASYRAVFLGGNIDIAYINTIFRTVVGTVLGLTVNICGAYALSKKTLPFRNAITMFLVFTMFFSGGMIPSYMNIKNLGLMDNIWVLILPMIANVYNLVILRNYIQGIDKGLEESAQIDGANQFTILFRIILPVCKPVLATVALWTMVAHWNSWFDALMYTNSINLTVLQYELRKILVQTENSEMLRFQAVSGDASAFTPESIKAAFMYISILPILFAYPFLQKYFVKGIMMGSLKG